MLLITHNKLIPSLHKFEDNCHLLEYQNSNLKVLKKEFATCFNKFISGDALLLNFTTLW